MLRVLLLVIGLLVASAMASSAHCTHYASPTGSRGAKGLTPTTPFRPRDFWSVASLPGKTLCLLDGVYRGDAFMLNPVAQSQPQPQGTAANPITIRALNDGAVLIDGQNARDPVYVTGPAKWVVWEGFNACCGGVDSQGVIRVGSNVSDMIFRRIVAWDAYDNPNTTDASVWTLARGAHSVGPNILIEDSAGFGRGRKIFTAVGHSGGITLRRFWARHGGYASTVSRPRPAVEPSYLSGDSGGPEFGPVIVENVLATRTAEAFNDLSVQNNSLFMPGRYSEIYGSVAYLVDYAVATPKFIFGNDNFGSLGDIKIKDLIVIRPPGFWNDRIGIFLMGPVRGQGGPYTQTIKDATSWTGAPDSIQKTYKQSNVCHSSTFPGSCPNPYTGSGAKVCKRYVGGNLSNDPLWPWPMDARIKAALATAGYHALAGSAGTDGQTHAANTITSELASLLGAIPSACYGKGGSPSPIRPSHR